MAFPDSNSNCMGDTKFHICLRTLRKLSDQHKLYNRDCKQDLKADIGHYWGYVFFRQVKDPTSKRGYFQKSFVLITRLPFHNLFSELVNRWAPIYFKSGVSALEQGYNQILQWPKLITNTPLQLPILGSIYQLYIAANTNRNQSESNPATTTNSSSEDVTNNNSNNDSSNTSSLSTTTIPININSPNEIDIFGPVHTIIHHIQLMWELILIAEPILIIAPSPTDSSLLVQALTNLIAPLDYLPEVSIFKIYRKRFIYIYALDVIL